MCWGSFKSDDTDIIFAYFGAKILKSVTFLWFVDVLNFFSTADCWVRQITDWKLKHQVCEKQKEESFRLTFDKLPENGRNLHIHRISVSESISTNHNIESKLQRAIEKFRENHEVTFWTS